MAQKENTEKIIFVFVYFQALKRKPVICKSVGVFRFSRFLVPSRQRNHRKSFYLLGKYFFAKENFRAAVWNLEKFYCGNKVNNRERAVSLRLARSGSQSQPRIWFILRWLTYRVTLSGNVLSASITRVPCSDSLQMVYILTVYVGTKLTGLLIFCVTFSVPVFKANPASRTVSAHALILTTPRCTATSTASVLN